MRPLNGQDMLRIWEQDRAESPLHKAVTLLALLVPDRSREELAALALGERDRLLLELRERTFGKTLSGTADCPSCHERLEVAFSTDDIKAGMASGASVREATVGGLHLRYRLPTSADLMAVATAPDVDTAARELARRCVLETRRGKRLVKPAAIPTEALGLLEMCMAEADPQAEVLLDLSCPSCGHRWQMVFDIANFFWTEIAAQAKRILLEVHTLARAYGWRESDILAMSARRRQAYLELVS